MHSEADKQLIKDCTTTKDTIEESIDWTDTNVAPADGREATLHTLRNSRRLAKRLETAAKRRPCVAIYGPSQAGKSYLVSNLAIPPGEDTLEILMPGTGKTVDFIHDINPAGGQESTGLVSRFTIVDKTQAGEKPFFLSLLSQVDLVKILANGYFSDLRDRTYEVDRNELAKTLEKCAAKAESSPVDSLDEDEIYDLKEYLQQFNNEAHVRDLARNRYWEDLARIAPYVRSEDRWELFHVIWGEVPVLTSLFNKLCAGLKKLGFAREARVGLEALVPKTLKIGERTVPNTIIDVRIIHGLIGDDPLEPVGVDGTNGVTANLQRSLVTALTAEITLVLPESTAADPKRAFFKDADVLDFPGARSRNKIPVPNLRPDARLEIIEVFLRGKIAFLFDRYCYRHEISSLVLCLPDSNPEVMTIPKLIGDWVYKTHGHTADDRHGKLASLFVVFTKFNIELEGKPDDRPGEPKSHDPKWNARFETNFVEYMSKPLVDKWPMQWDKNGPFKNCFLLRDPKWSRAIYEGVAPDGKGLETAIRKEYVGKLQDMETSFVNHNWVGRHFFSPKEAWTESTEVGKSGIDYLVRFMTPTCDPAIKRGQLANMLLGLKKEVHGLMSRYYTSGDLQSELERAQRDAIVVVKALVAMMQARNSFGVLLNKLQVNDDFAWKIYFNVENPYIPKDEPENGNTDHPVIPVDANKILSDLGLDDLIEDASDTPEQGTPAEFRDKAEIFAENLLQKWRIALEDFIASRSETDEVGLPQDVCKLLVREITKSTQRVALTNQIADATREAVKRPHDVRNLDLISRLATMSLNEFVNTLGWNTVQEDERPKVKGPDGGPTPIFLPEVKAAPHRNDIRLDIDFPGNASFVQWVKGAQAIFMKNVEYTFGGGIPNAEANSRLGELLARVEG